MAEPRRARWQSHVVRQLNGRAEENEVPAQFQVMSEQWDSDSPDMPNIGGLPYLVYMPEKDRVLLSMDCIHPRHAPIRTWVDGDGPIGPTWLHTLVAESDDRGATWSQRRWVHTGPEGHPDFRGPGLTYLGNGRVTLNGDPGVYTPPVPRAWSSDWGRTWEFRGPIPRSSDGKDLHAWDPVLVDKDSAGNVVRLVETRHSSIDVESGVHSQACVWFSTDLGQSWSDEIEPPQWREINEIALARAANGDIVGACRTDSPKRFAPLHFDHYSGLGVSISSDNGLTWSELNMLYEWGRHHPSMVVLPDGDIVMSYVVRLGYTDAPDGYPQYGVEAVVSHDHGKTWDLDHRYLLSVWKGRITGPLKCYGACQSSSTVLLPDGEMLTAFGTGFRNPEPKTYNMEVGLVKWRVSDQPVDGDRTIADAPFDSELRNVFDPRVDR